jgi:ATP-dependent RNA helicase DeaD
MDHMRRGTLKLANVNVAVLDEADEMLDMGFRDAIQTILEQTSVVRQTLLFSATMPFAIMELARRYQKSSVARAARRARPGPPRRPPPGPAAARAASA